MKIIGINIVILVIYTLAINIVLGISTPPGPDNYGYLGQAILLMGAIGLQTFLNLFISLAFFTKKKREEAKWYLLSAGAVLVVGFSACWGGAMLMT
ncbi:MAG: hypothetical protein AB7H80_02240 [Candidatus Kapaibacterium sp.]